MLRAMEENTPSTSIPLITITNMVASNSGALENWRGMWG